ncbi:gamma-glutamyltransferase family protein [Reinekea thalattae]|uniref:Gamma-glutamyltransferase family protein n=1 Tax=Reinekea thalattae TaxID=2593301 RepID=A0A5C8Z4U2_9GAMM|nr:gamma-glutamyltransferase family protein [Reinekea thalattae]TXR51950.1 gamma-glutamyltransferase family protein [Reinekea thalattae]
MAYQTAFTAPHFKAAEVGQAILDQGGTASEAMVAAAAMIAVQYPHMNSIGGDSFWLVSKVAEAPYTIDGCGAAARGIELESFCQQYQQIPDAGGGAAITMAGTISAWQKALQKDATDISLNTLLKPAINAAAEGIDVTESLVAASEKTLPRLASLKHFAEIYLKQGQPLQVGDRITNQALANTLQWLADNGLDDFYRGKLARSMTQDLEAAGSPLRLADFLQHQAQVLEPLTVNTLKAQLFNFGAPTQGVASLLILAIYDRLADQASNELDHMHLLVEATKQAFILRDQWVCDEAYLQQPLQDLLSDEVIQGCVNNVSLTQAKPWPHVAEPGDTIWMGATDQYGTMVSFIQSIYWEFGSGVFLPNSGVLWNVRGKSFSLDSKHHNVLAGGKKPFHTLNPAYAELTDGRRMVYGTMGGEGQPQTQACLFSRAIYQGDDLASAIAKPRWLLGRTWGDESHSLRLEKSLYEQSQTELEARGHELACVSDNNELMGHAGAVILNTEGLATAATDPRSDGQCTLGNKNEN